MSTRWGTRLVRGLVVGLAAGALVVPAAMAKGPGGNPGGPGEEASANNLSVPAYFIGANTFGLTCDGSATAPDGEPSTGFMLDGYYYVQGENTWQAGCEDGLSSLTATAAWGDNLKGTARLKVRTPIRVEIGLVPVGVAALTGWDVVKLEPEMLDRLSPYGTKAVLDGAGAFVSQPSTTLGARGWSTGTLDVYLMGDEENTLVVHESATAEINATGKVVFGYNLRVADAGDYLIRYTFDDVTFSGADWGTFSGSTAEVTISVAPGGGGNKGGNH